MNSPFALLRPVVALCLLSALAGAAPLATFAPAGATLDNGQVAARFDAKGEMVSLRHAGGPNLIQTGYMTGPYLDGRSAIAGRLVRSTAEVGEIAYTFRASNVDFDVHYVILPGKAGVYCFLALRHAAGPRGDRLGFFKHVIKADPSLFTYLQSTDEEQGFPPPESAIAHIIGNPSDHTYELNPKRFDNGYCKDYYSKYDYMQYAYQHAVYGLYSPKTGDGLYVINAGLDWVPGGPTKSLQTVHNDAVINDIINDEHMLQNFYQDNAFPAAEWRKLAGPFFIYAARAPDPVSAWTAAKRQAAAETAEWPYRWMDHPDYPLRRATVAGTLSVTAGSAAHAWCVLAAPGSDWQDQCLAYDYWTRADGDGHFILRNVRPGRYVLHAFGGAWSGARQGNPFNEFASRPMVLTAGSYDLPAAELVWKAESYGTKRFQIGIPDHSTREFALGNLRRQYHLWAHVPGDYDYRVPAAAASEAELIAYEAKHWFYLQSEDNSRWKIHFPVDAPLAADGKAALTLDIIGTCKSPQLYIAVNGHGVVDSGNYSSFPQLAFGDDASVRRCAVNGAYFHHAVVPFPSRLLKIGPENVVTLTVHIPGKKPDAGGIMYDAIKLEAN